MSKVFIRTWLIILIIIAIFIRVHGVDQYAYGDDELLHTAIAGADSLKQVLQFSLYEAHPPLGNILRHYWQEISDTVWFSRLFSLLFGIALVPLYYRIGRRLGGEFAGLCAAALITFSFGCIIQSYIARNYTVFLLFLSLSFDAWLSWREKPSLRSLLQYGGFGLLACLTHFFAVLSLTPLAVLEALRLYRTGQKSKLLQWLGINALLAVSAVLITLPWRKTLALAQPYSHFPTDLTQTVYNALSYPFHDLDYLLPSPYALYLLILLFALRAGKHSQATRNCLALAACGIGIKIFMIVTLHYSSSGTRHDLWLIPLIIPCAALIISDAASAYSSKTHTMAIMLLTAGLLAYSPQRRFTDYSEYGIKQANLDAVKYYLETLDEHDAIIAERDEAFRIKDIYPYLGDAAFTGKDMALKIPYESTSLIVNPYYRRLRTRNLLLTTLKAAEEQHMLDGVERLIFMHSYPQAVLIGCPELDRQIFTFPPTGKSFTAEEAFANPAMLLIVRKKDFLEQVVSENGKAYHCLKENTYLEQYVEPPPGNKIHAE
ncbi:MAG TPA: glycosyltransferase family 39 protein [Rickettsiales bacterium]|nr:glycosyltransferase family 39 protein [Rickettsiales bacterium]